MIDYIGILWMLKILFGLTLIDYIRIFVDVENTLQSDSPGPLGPFVQEGAGPHPSI